MKTSEHFKSTGFALSLAILLSGESALAGSSAGYSHPSVAAPALDNVRRDKTHSISGALLPNGSFETNGGVGTSVFANWTVVDLAGSNGSWLVQTGTTSPVPETMFEVNPPTLGSFAAMTDQTAPGSYTLYQDVVIPAGGTTIAFDLFIRNLANDFYVPSPPSLDYNVNFNQQFRADLLDPDATDFDVGPGVVANLYQTQPGDPLTSGYVRITRTVDGTGVDRTLRLRFAVVDDQSNLNVGIDNVTLGVGSGAPSVLPILDLRALILLGTLLALASIGFIRRQRTR